MSLINSEIKNPWQAKFTPIVNFETGVFGVECDVVGKITNEFASLKEKAIRQALQAHGWVSPEDAQKMRDELAILRQL